MGERITYISSAGDPGGGAPLAAWHELALAAEYDTGESAEGTEPDLAAFLTASLGAPMWMGADWLLPKAPVITVGPHTWSAPDASSIRSTSADVTVTFADGSSLTQSVVFTNKYIVDGPLYAVKLGTVSAHVDTGLTMDYGYEFRVRGRTQNGQQAALVSAHESTSKRTSLRLLGGSNYFQHQWPSNQDVRNSGIDARSMFSYVQNKDGVTFTQGETTYSFPYAGTQSGTGSAAIWLLNDNYNSSYGQGVLAEAEILDENGNTLRHFKPWRLSGEVVLLDVANGNQAYRPTSGALVEVTP